MNCETLSSLAISAGKLLRLTLVSVITLMYNIVSSAISFKIDFDYSSFQKTDIIECYFNILPPC